MNNNLPIAVIGAGITGLTTALSLARRGYNVEIIEREPYVAMMASYANGGQFSVSNSDTWCTWTNVLHGIQWMFSPGAPLLVRPWPSASKIRWMSGFLLNTANGTQKTNTTDTIRMALRARELYDSIAKDENITFDHSQHGILHFYKNRTSLERAKRSCDFYQSLGVNRYPVTKEELLRIEPSLANTQGIIGGTYTPDDGMGDIHMFCTNLANVLRTKYRVTISTGIQVKEVHYKRRGDLSLKLASDVNENVHSEVIQHYRAVVICAGADSADFGRQIGDPVNIYPIKGYSLTIPLTDPQVAPQTSLLDDDSKIVASKLGQKLRIAGTAELDDWNLDIRQSRIEPLHRWVHNNLPGISTEMAVPWTGLRPMTPSMMPIVRQSRADARIWWNTGHGHLGWTVAPATAEIITNQMQLSFQT